MGTQPSTSPADVSADGRVERAVEGDVAAIREILEAVAPRVHAVARRVLGPGDPDTEDVTQEALIALVRALPSFRGEGTVAAFAARIGVRTAVASRNRRRRRAERRRARSSRICRNGSNSGSWITRPTCGRCAAMAWPWRMAR